MKFSARNQFTAKVTHITDGSVNSEVTLGLPNGDFIVAIITKASVASLGLAVGKEATALVKASSVLLAAGASKLPISARNQLLGKIASITDGAVNAEVVVTLSGGAQIVAGITVAAKKELALAVGSPVVALVKASSVIVAVA